MARLVSAAAVAMLVGIGSATVPSIGQMQPSATALVSYIIGGRRRSKAKASAAKANGAKGGRRRKRLTA